MANNLQQTTFSYTWCTDLYSYLKWDALQLYLGLCTQGVTNWEVPLLLVHLVYEH